MTMSLLDVPAMLLFEVMDKEPRLAQRVILYSVLTVLGVLLAGKRWWFGLTVLPVVALFASADVSELSDPFVGPAIVKEAGWWHVVLWYALIMASIALPLLTAANVRRRKSL
jgi:uncharacterized membrane protein YhhN